VHGQRNIRVIIRVQYGRSIRINGHKIFIVVRGRARDKSDSTCIRERIGGCGDRRGRGKRSPGETHGEKGVCTLEQARAYPSRT